MNTNSIKQEALGIKKFLSSTPRYYSSGKDPIMLLGESISQLCELVAEVADRSPAERSETVPLPKSLVQEMITEHREALKYVHPSLMSTIRERVRKLETALLYAD